MDVARTQGCLAPDAMVDAAVLRSCTAKQALSSSGAIELAARASFAVDVAESVEIRAPKVRAEVCAVGGVDIARGTVAALELVGVVSFRRIDDAQSVVVSTVDRTTVEAGYLTGTPTRALTSIYCSTGLRAVTIWGAVDLAGS